jgi:hypothetical protein
MSNPSKAITKTINAQPNTKGSNKIQERELQI